MLVSSKNLLKLGDQNINLLWGFPAYIERKKYNEILNTNKLSKFIKENT